MAKISFSQMQKFTCNVIENHPNQCAAAGFILVIFGAFKIIGILFSLSALFSTGMIVAGYLLAKKASAAPEHNPLIQTIVAKIDLFTPQFIQNLVS